MKSVSVGYKKKEKSVTIRAKRLTKTRGGGDRKQL